MGPEWGRLDNWRLYEEPFELVFGYAHRFAAKDAIALDDLKPERFLVRTHCESRADVIAQLRLDDLGIDRRHEVSSDQDLISLLELNIGVSVLPQTVSAPETVLRSAISGVEVQRTVHLYGVAGRQRSPVASTFMKMLRAASWPKPH
jgi:DNA-binding transcriptional LysR family regulator